MFYIYWGRVDFGIEFFGIPIPRLKTEIWRSCKIIRKILCFYGFLTFGIFSGFSKNARDFRQIPGIRVFLVPGFGFFFVYFWILTTSSEFGIFYLREQVFFVGWDITTKSQLCILKFNYHKDLNKQGDLRNSLILVGVTPLWHVAQWVSRAPQHHTIPAFLDLNGTLYLYIT